MSKISHNRRHHGNRPQHHHPIFCSSSEVEMPKLMDDYLYHMQNTKASHHPLSSKPNVELNSNLEQIFRAYLVQFWRHNIEKEHGSCRLWDEITGCPPPLRSRPRPYPPHLLRVRKDPPSPYPPPPADWWWKHEAFRDDPSPPSSPRATTPPTSSSAPPSVSAPTSSSSSSSSSTNSTPDTPSSVRSTPESSPGAQDTCADDAQRKTRWQSVAEKLFAHLLRIPRFSLHLHMQHLIRVHHQSTLRKDAELADIIKNYLTTVL